MKEIIDYLIDLEHNAGDLYEKASTVLKDQGLCSLLDRLAEHEAWHFHAMGNAAAHIDKFGDVVDEVVLDDETKNRITAPFERTRTLLKENRLTKESMIEMLVATELSEWNDLFIYVMNYFRDKVSEFKYVIPKIQHHVRYIEKTLANFPEAVPYLAKIKTIEPVWTEKILVVDDFEPLLELVSSILEKYGKVEKAANGQIALEKAMNKYYAVIVSDVSMPVKGGFEFYEQLALQYPDVKKRFIFMSGNFSERQLRFLQENQIRYLEKPVQLTDMHQAVFDVLQSQNDKIRMPSI